MHLYEPSGEKLKPFRLVKYFTLASLIVVFLGTVILAFLNIHWARAMQHKKSEDYAKLLVENLNHQVFLQFIIPVVMKYGKVQLRNELQQEALDQVVRSTLHSFKVERVNIYDMEGTIAYSFDPKLVGRDDLAGIGYRDAVEGGSTSRLVQKGSWLTILLGVSEENQIVTFAPLRAERPLAGLSGPVLGVVEIVQDVSEDYTAIFRFQTLVITTSMVVMGPLLLILILIVKRGENIIEQRALERLRLKEKLSRAEHLSSLGEMVASVSHEIRNPLGIIRSSAELLKKKLPEDSPANPIFSIIVEEATRLNGIITDFLNYARPREPNLAPCRVDEIIEKNQSNLAAQIEAGGYRLRTEVTGQPVEISADADMLYQAFLNLIINAMQAMTRGGTIGVAIRFAASAVTVCLEDEGPGIAEEHREKIWDPFFTTKPKGTGLGLGIVKNIVKAHGGRIVIANRSAGGARVTVELPRHPKGSHGNHPDR